MMGKQVLLLLLCTCFFGCGQFPEKESLDHRLYDKIVILGHGGMGSRALVPMNSKASFDECFSLSPDGTEVDVQMTNDGVLVCYHDEKIDRGTTCTGKISDYTWEELTTQCEYDTWSSGKEFVRLDSLIKNNGGLGAVFSLDLKEGHESYEHNLRMRGQILRLAVNNPKTRFLIETWDNTGLWGFEDYASNMLFFQLCDNAEGGFKAISWSGFDGISIDYRKITAEEVKMIHEESYFVMVHGANTAAGNKEAVALSPDVIQTDRLDHLLKGVEKYGW